MAQEKERQSTSASEQSPPTPTLHGSVSLQLIECSDEDLLADDETWLAFVEPCFCNDASAAENFAHFLQTLKEAIESGGSEGQRKAICTLQDGIRITYPYTDAHKAALRLFNLYLAGKLKTPEDEPLILISAAIERSESMTAGMTQTERKEQ